MPTTTIFDQPLDPTYLVRMAERHQRVAARLRAEAQLADGDERDALLARAARHEQDAARDRERAA